MNETPKTEREQYIERLQGDLAQAALSKKFLDSEEGKYVIDYISEVQKTLTEQMLNNRKTYEEYVELRAKVDILRRLNQVLAAKSSDTVIAKLSEDLQLAQTGE